MELKNKKIEKISHLTDSIKEDFIEVWEICTEMSAFLH